MPFCGGAMFKFRATLTLGSSAKKKEIYENGPDLSAGGAYRTHGDEYIGRSSLSEPPKKLTPSMVKLPPSHKPAALKTSKSASNLASSNIPLQVSKSTPDISTNPRGTSNSTALTSKDAKRQEKERKDLEKKRLAEQKKREKAAAQEQARQDKLRIQRDRQIAQQQARDVKMRKEQEKQKSKNKGTTQAAIPIPNAAPSNIPPPPPMRANPLGQQTQYNTLESSISRSSGPPPYTEAPKPPVPVPNKRDNTGNTSFGKPIEESSWDMISEHRHQISRTVASGAPTKQMMLDLQYSFEKAQVNANGSKSEA